MGGKRTNALELLQIREAIPTQGSEVKVIECLGNLLWEPAHPQDRLDRRLFLLVSKIIEEHRHSIERFLREPLLQGKPCQLSGREVQLQDAAAFVNGAAEGFIHPTTPPWRS